MRPGCTGRSLILETALKRLLRRRVF